MITGHTRKHDQTVDTVFVHFPHPTLPQLRGLFRGELDSQPLGDGGQRGLSRQVLPCQASKRLKKLV
jgi:hypothetical protein